MQKIAMQAWKQSEMSYHVQEFIPESLFCWYCTAANPFDREDIAPKSRPSITH
jgi:hypothetical protein